MLSLHIRNPLINYGGDVVFSLLLFLGIFLPWGKKWSVDAKKQIKLRSTQFYGIASVAYLLQVCFLYWFASFLKIQSGWIIDYDSLYYVVASNAFVTPLIELLRVMPDVLFFIGTGFIVWFDIVAPLFFFIPFKTEYFRKKVVQSFIGKHLLFNVFLFLGIFSFVVSIFMVGLLPASVWESRLMKSVSKILDKVFPVDSSASLDLGHSRFYVLMEKGVLSFFIVVVTWSNLLSVDYAPFNTPKVVRRIAYVFNFNQRWGMFSPVSHEEYWPKISGELISGKQVNVLNPDQPVVDSAPKYIPLEISHERKYQYLLTLEDPRFIQVFCEYELSKWNKNHSVSERMTKLTYTNNYREILPRFKYSSVREEEVSSIEL